MKASLSSFQYHFYGLTGSQIPLAVQRSPSTQPILPAASHISFSWPGNWQANWPCFGRHLSGVDMDPVSWVPHCICIRPVASGLHVCPRESAVAGLKHLLLAHFSDPMHVSSLRQNSPTFDARRQILFPNPFLFCEQTYGFLQIYQI